MDTPQDLVYIMSIVKHLNELQSFLQNGLLVFSKTILIARRKKVVQLFHRFISNSVWVERPPSLFVGILNKDRLPSPQAMFFGVCKGMTFGSLMPRLSVLPYYLYGYLCLLVSLLIAFCTPLGFGPHYEFIQSFKK